LLAVGADGLIKVNDYGAVDALDSCNFNIASS